MDGLICRCRIGVWTHAQSSGGEGDRQPWDEKKNYRATNEMLTDMFEVI